MAGSGNTRKRARRGKISGGHRVQLVLISFFLTFCILQLLLMIFRFAPYGTRSLATADARIQYLDFFSYYKDVLQGKNTIGYTFTSGLGLNAIGLFSYYLASPFNLLALFFSKTQVNSLLNLLVSLKLSTAAGTFSWYLQRRFRDRIPEWQSVLLAAGYALMQYNLSQCSNVMWLDGVYMLPLMLLGVYELVREGRILLLSVATALSILFNWYTGGMNCLCAGMWFVFEYLLRRMEVAEATGRTFRKLRDKAADLWAAGDRAEGAATMLQPVVRFLSAFIRFCLSMGIGVMISAALFLPTVAALRRGKGDAFYPEEYMLNRMRGNLLTVFRDYSIGSVSTNSGAALFCGSLALVACLAFFICRHYSVGKRILGGALLLTTLLTFYWQPLYFVFSLFQGVNSYWYRHGYMGSMAVLFLAAAYLASRPWTTALDPQAQPDRQEGGENRPDTGHGRARAGGLPVHVRMPAMPALTIGGMRLYLRPIIAAFLMAVAATILMVAMWALEPSGSSWQIALSACLLMITAGLCVTPAGLRGRGHRRVRLLCGALLVVITVFELVLNTYLLMNRFSSDSAEEYRIYSAQQQAQIAEIRSRDTGFYRISQTRGRYYDKNGMTACFNDSLAYNYPSAASYTSMPENDVLWFLDRLGYAEEGSCINVVNTSIVSADALLGIKYILSDYPIKGLTRVPGLGTYNGKTVYENPYALPLAYVYDGGELPQQKYHDPFTYQNDLYSTLSGQRTMIFRPVDAARQAVGDRTAFWKVSLPEGNVSIYGNLVWKEFLNGRLTVNESMTQGYARWLSPTVFYVPYSQNVDTFVKLETEEPLVLEEEQFYALDLDELAAVTRKIKERKAADLVVENGHITCTAEAEEGQRLFVTIPRSEGWTVTVNGRKVPTERFAYCLMTVPLDAGHNEIELRYSIPRLGQGIVVSVIGILLLVAFEILRMQIMRREKARRMKARREARQRAAAAREKEPREEKPEEEENVHERTDQ